ncbi:LacI family DNA-binding transcriptional regulator [Streptomyces thinghirensis]|uniref:LacI family DNA-binding transcriptional regulator n=1 Tax=Streptomyces thinghirensis TaxID=551547 RepID=A0ABP9T5X6_9ACTN
MPDTASSPTLAQIARLAGVSVPTVSRVANGRDNVSTATRQRVEAAMRRTGYVQRHRPRPGASSLVDVVVPGLSTGWTAEILRGAEEAATRDQLSLVISQSTPGDCGGRAAGGWLDALGARGTAGVLFTATDLPPAQRQWLAHHAVPHVLIEPACAPPPDTAAVRTADRAGGQVATEHLLHLGHRDIAVIARHGHHALHVDTERLAGYRSALAAAGLHVRQQYLRYAGSVPERASQVAHDLLALEQPPTAVLVCSTELAAVLYEAAAQWGLRVPGDVSVVGFDDLAGANRAVPELTAVEPDAAEMSAWGMRTLVTMMHGETVPPGVTEASPRLVVRRSTAAPSPARRPGLA